MVTMKTITIRIDTGELSLAGVPAGVVSLECGYLHSKSARAPLGDAFKIEDTDEKNRAVLSRIAQHLVASWSVGPLDVAHVARFLLELYDEEPVVAAKAINRLADGERFGRPKLLDAEDLGNA